MSLYLEKEKKLFSQQIRNKRCNFGESIKQTYFWRISVHKFIKNKLKLLLKDYKRVDMCWSSQNLVHKLISLLLKVKNGEQSLNYMMNKQEWYLKFLHFKTIIFQLGQQTLTNDKIKQLSKFQFKQLMILLKTSLLGHIYLLLILWFLILMEDLQQLNLEFMFRASFNHLR